MSMEMAELMVTIFSFCAMMKRVVHVVGGVELHEGGVVQESVRFSDSV
jgi:hypothetical protein